ncbi:hypothetical protein PCE1_003006 [Barthelona sp. PCE]
METLDWTIFWVYIVVMIGLGFYLSRKNKSNKSYFFAGRDQKSALVIGVSIAATAMSSVNYSSFPTEIYGNGMYVTLSLPMFIIVALPQIKFIIPYFTNMDEPSAYSFLSKVFNRTVQAVVSVAYIIWRTTWAAVAMYICAKVLGLLADIELVYTIWICGLVCLVYAGLGGLRAILVTDLIQTCVMWGSVLIALIITSYRASGFFSMFNAGVDAEMTKPFSPFDSDIFTFDYTERISVLSAFIGVMIAFIARYGVDQIMIAKYMAAKNEKVAKKGFHISYIVALVMLISLAMLAFAMRWQADDTGKSGGPIPALKHMILLFQSFPQGFAGLLAAGLLAAAMSSVDSAANSCANAFVVDIYVNLFKKDKKKKPSVLLSKGMTVVFCIIGILVGWLIIAEMEKSIFVIANRILNAFGSPVLAVFIIAMFDTFVDNVSIIIGVVFGVGVSIYSAGYIDDIAIHLYAAIDLIATLGAAYLSAFILWVLEKRGWYKRRFTEGREAFLFKNRKNIKMDEEMRALDVLVESDVLDESDETDVVEEALDEVENVDEEEVQEVVDDEVAEEELNEKTVTDDEDLGEQVPAEDMNVEDEDVTL